MKKIKEKLFIAFFGAILLFPMCGIIIDKHVSLNGVTEEVTSPIVTTEGIMDGTVQSTFNSWIENHISGRKILIKLRSQLLYSLLKESPNNNVVIGKDNYLFEPGYIYRELNIWQAEDDSYFDDLFSKLENLQKICEEKGKELYIFITPSKAFFCKDKIPERYFALGHGSENNYQKFKRYAAESNLKIFDSHEYIVEHESEIDAPVFYSTGIHWSAPWGQRCANEFAKYISDNSKWNLGIASQSIKNDKKGPKDPDADLYNSLNLIVKPDKEIYYKSSLELEEASDVPVVFFRGGSFMGQSLGALSGSGAVNVSAHFENNYYFIDNYSEMKTLSAFDAYSEFEDMDEYLSKSDILVLEANEGVFPNMSWGFIEYVLDNPEVLGVDE